MFKLYLEIEILRRRIAVREEQKNRILMLVVCAFWSDCSVCDLYLCLSDLLTMLSSLARLKVLSSEVSRRWAGRICISIEWNVSSCLSLTCLDLFLLLTSAWLYCCCIVCLEVNTIKFVCKKINPLLFLRKFEYLAPLIFLS